MYMGLKTTIDTIEVIQMNSIEYSIGSFITAFPSSFIVANIAFPFLNAQKFVRLLFGLENVM